MNGIASAGASAPSEEKGLRKLGSISSALKGLDESIMDLEKTVASHEVRIQPILTPVPPKNSDKGEDEGSPTDLGRSITNMKYRIRAVTEYIHSFDSRIEL